MKNNNEPQNKLARRLDFNDMFFTGVAYMIGAGIFTLLPFVIRYGGKNAVLSFIIGGILCLFTGFSFARLNYQYPVNDAEYSWILEIFKKKGEEKPKKSVKAFAGITIWVVGIMGIFSMALLALGLNEYIQTYDLGIPKRVIILVSLALPTIINMIGVTSVANFAKIIINIVIAAFVVLIGSAAFKGNPEFIKENSLKPDLSNGMNLVRASFLTIYAFTGFQSVVQLSEETISKDIIPKSITASVIFVIIFYCLIVFSVIALIGLSSASDTVYPVSAAFNAILGTRGRDVVSIISIVTMFSALVILVLGVSRLFHKLAEKKIAPKYLSKLMPIDRMFSKNQENFQNNLALSSSPAAAPGDSLSLNELGGNAIKDISEYPDLEVKGSKFDKMPIPALITLFVLAFGLTYIKGGVLELVANATNSMLAFIFTVVNLLVIVNYYKTKDIVIETKSKAINRLFKMYPWYAVIGVVVSFIFLILSPKFYDIV